LYVKDDDYKKVTTFEVKIKFSPATKILVTPMTYLHRGRLNP